MSDGKTDSCYVGQVRAYDNNFKKDLSYLFWPNKRTGYIFPSVTARVFYGNIIQLLRKHIFFGLGLLQITDGSKL